MKVMECKIVPLIIERDQKRNGRKSSAVSGRRVIFRYGAG